MPWPNHFDFLAPIYDRVIKASEANLMAELAELPSDGYLLDAGGGTGRFAIILQRLVANLVVADLSSRMLLEAQAKGLSTTCTLTERLPFPAETFERVLMVDALHHVSNQGESVREMVRVLKPGGIMVIVEPDIHHLGVKLIALFEKLALMRSHFLSAQHIVALFPDSGAEVKVRRDNYNLFVTYKRVSLGE